MNELKIDTLILNCERILLGAIIKDKACGYNLKEFIKKYKWMDPLHSKIFGLISKLLDSDNSLKNISNLIRLIASKKDISTIEITLNKINKLKINDGQFEFAYNLLDMIKE